MFEYFPTHYSWNMGLLMAAQLGGELGEIDEACRPLRELAAHPGAKDDPKAQAAWIEQWSTLARKVEEFAGRDEAAGHSLSAGKKYLRACLYWFTAERMASHTSAQKLAMYQSMVTCFERGVRLRNEPIEFVNIPYEGTTLSALLHRAPGAGPQARNDPLRRLRCHQGMDAPVRDLARVRGARHFDVDGRPSGDRRRAATAGSSDEP